MTSDEMVMEDRADYMTAVGFARMYLGSEPPDVGRALEVLDEAVHKTHARMRNALIESGHDVGSVDKVYPPPWPIRRPA